MKFQEYGTLITVIALLLVVVYSGEPYDGWDVVLAGFAGYFAVAYLKGRQNTDWFSTLAASFLATASISTGLLALNCVLGISEKFNDIAEQEFYRTSLHLWLVSVFSLILSFVLPRGKA